MRLRDLLSRPCVFHDRPPTPVQIAQLEEEAGINPRAVAELLAASAPVVENFYDPDLIDCGRRRCRNRRTS